MVSQRHILSMCESAIVMAMICFAGQSSAQTKEAETTANGEDASGKIHIGVVCINSVTGKRHLAGINEALDNHKWGKENVRLTEFGYSNSRQGRDTLLGLIRSDQDAMAEGGVAADPVDVIIGPTESDVFVRVLNDSKELAGSPVPVVSGLITADVGNEPDGWFFRTNVDVSRRVNAIYDFLNKYWIQSISVVHADTEFGRRAAAAFQEEVQTQRYEALSYTDDKQLRIQLRKVLDARPEAVGFFGERSQIEHVYRKLRRMNDGLADYLYSAPCMIFEEAV